MRGLITASIAAAMGFAVASASAPAQARDGVQCVRLREIQASPVVDEHTIVLKLLGKDRYKRVTLTGGCQSIPFSGFAHTNPSDELCNTDPIMTADGGGCIIKDMVDISPAEAQQLLHRKR
jgi:hypothetical protein